MPILDALRLNAAAALKSWNAPETADWHWRPIGGMLGALSDFLPGAKRDYATDAGDFWRNSAAASVISWVQQTYSEAVLEVQEQDAEGNWQGLAEHPLVELIEEPNPFYGGEVLWYSTILSFLVDGNAYWRKVRAAAGSKVLELWYVPHWMMEPRGESSSSRWITHYVYRIGGRDEVVPKEDVVHFRWGQDPRAPRLGASPWKQAGAREIDSDNKAGTYTAAILRNAGGVSMVISPAGDTEISDPMRQQLLQLYRDRQTGENAGLPLVAGRGVKVDRLAFSPQEMALESIRNVPEARICSLIGVKPLTVGLSVGEETKSYANMAQAEKQSLQNCVIPMQKLHARTVTRQLLPEFERDAHRRRIHYDLSDVEALQPDQSLVRRDAALLYQSGVATLGQAKELAKLSFEDAESQVYVWEAQARARGGGLEDLLTAAGGMLEDRQS